MASRVTSSRVTVRMVEERSEPVVSKLAKSCRPTSPCPALHMAAAWGHVDVVRLLVENGADATVRDDEGMMPAMMAESSKRVPNDHLQAVVEYFHSINR